MKDLAKIKCFLIDMDGTFYLDNELIDGALDFIEVIKKKGADYLFLTNNSSKNRDVYQKKLSDMGCKADKEKVFTSGEAAVIYLANKNPAAKIFLLGTKHLENEFEKAGFLLTNKSDVEPDYVVLGFDTGLTYDKLWKACDYIRDGKEYIATHPDYNCPLKDGKFMPDTGAMIEFIAASTGKRPYVIGKPNIGIIEAITGKYGYKREELAIIGDRLYTDIKTGQNAGITSILVLTGETTAESYEASDIKADYVFDGIKQLADEIKKLNV